MSEAEDFAALFRLDIQGGMPRNVVRNYIVQHLFHLRKLPPETPDRDHAIHDIERFLSELS